MYIIVYCCYGQVVFVVALDHAHPVPEWLINSTLALTNKPLCITATYL